MGLGVFEDPGVMHEVNEARLKWDWAEDVFELTKWAIALDPEAGKPVTESGITRAYTYQGARSGPFPSPSCTVLYSIGATDITIHKVRFQNAKPYIQQIH